MAIRNIVKKGDEILRKKCKPVTEFNEKLWAILDDMRETLINANGAGLAAPQVGIMRRYALIRLLEDVDKDHEDEAEIVEMINPVIIKKSGRQRDIEGCLSCPNVFGYVKRPKKCVVRFQDRNGNTVERAFTGLGCRAACHETDHLDGVLFVDLVDEYVDPDED